MHQGRSCFLARMCHCTSPRICFNKWFLVASLLTVRSMPTRLLFAGFGRRRSIRIHDTQVLPRISKAVHFAPWEEAHRGSCRNPTIGRRRFEACRVRGGGREPRRKSQGKALTTSEGLSSIKPLLLERRVLVCHCSQCSRLLNTFSFKARKTRCFLPNRAARTRAITCLP